jgi:hypothetical protein
MMRRCPHCKLTLTRDFILKAASMDLAHMYAHGERDEIWEYLPKQLGVGLAASITSRLRTVFKGQEPVIRACPHCHEKFPAREMRVHKPRCPKNPKNK